jgi:hypothetical protein
MCAGFSISEFAQRSVARRRQRSSKGDFPRPRSLTFCKSGSEDSILMRQVMLQTTGLSTLAPAPFQPAPPPPAQTPSAPKAVDGNFLAHNRLPLAAKIQVALDLLSGHTFLEMPTITQAAQLARVHRQRIYESGAVDLKRKVKGAALARAFCRASPEEQIAFVRAIGTEGLWSALTEAL